MSDNTNISVSDQSLEELDNELATPSDYTHTFSTPFVWMGKTYETLDFDFGKLRGRDSLAIYQELQMRGIIVVTARTSQHYQMYLASKGCGLGVDAFEEMPLRDFEVILSKARNFIPAAALL